MLKNVIFDLGKVLIEWDVEEFAKRYSSDPKIQKIIPNDIFYHSDWHLLDKGGISEEDLEISINRRTGLEITEVRNIILEARKIMSLKEKTHRELLRLKDKYTIFCISNMSHKSWEVVKNEHNFMKHFKDIVISAEVKMIKPCKEIFTFALNKFKIKPEESLFIDDLEDNIEAAKSVGIDGILFDESKKCWDKINSL